MCSQARLSFTCSRFAVDLEVAASLPRESPDERKERKARRDRKQSIKVDRLREYKDLLDSHAVDGGYDWDAILERSLTQWGGEGLAPMHWLTSSCLLNPLPMSASAPSCRFCPSRRCKQALNARHEGLACVAKASGFGHTTLHIEPKQMSASNHLLYYECET